MAYFLGRDVVVALTTEDADTLVVSDSNAAAAVEQGSYDSESVIAGPRADFAASGTTTFGTQTCNSNTFSNEVADLTGCDLSIGATDEDISYFGQRTVLKAEIKKETTITITRKKSNNNWDVAFNGARYGIQSDGTGIRGALDEQPDDVNYGYRAYLKLKDTSEIFVVRNCCIQAHSVTLNVDGTTEETLELYTNVEPLIVSADSAAFAVTGVGDL